MTATDWSELTERISALKPGLKGKWGKMNFAEMLVHCRLGLETALGEYKTKPGHNFFTRNIVKNIVFNVPWPKGKAPTPPDLDVQKNGVKTRSEEEELSALKQAFEKFKASRFDSNEHPFFGRLNFKEWVHLQKKHFNHHLMQFGR